MASAVVGGEDGGLHVSTAWVSLATNDSYAVGALVLAHSLRAACTRHKLVLLLAPSVSPTLRRMLECVCDEVVSVDVMQSRDTANLALLSRPELGVTFTKLHCWTLHHYSKCVFLDADCLVVSNCDELFERDELSAAADIGWPDCFNSGVFVFRPSLATFNKLLHLATTTGSFDGGDQGLLNEFFSGWSTGDASRRLPFIYNMTISSTYSCLPALKRFGSGVKIVHFLGVNKPWLTSDDSIRRPGATDHCVHAPGHFERCWWRVYHAHVAAQLQHCLQPSDSSEHQHELSTVLARMCHVTGSAGQEVIDPVVETEWKSEQQRAAWEQGEPDYMGADRFDNIMAKISGSMTHK